MSINALVIGCGNIGALYDLDKPHKVWTHVKAFSLFPEIELTVTDADTGRAADLAEKYKARLLKDPVENVLGRFDIISISTPTPTHHQYLKAAMKANVPVIICEKPVAGSLEELAELEELYRDSDSRVLINYIRRFQPAYLEFRKIFRQKEEEGGFRSIIVKYKRGFLNNGGHALDLLEFLTGQPIQLDKFQLTHSVFDAFDYDPTISGTSFYGGRPINFVGINSVNYPVFEIEIFYLDSKIVICHSGNEIRFYKTTELGLEELAGMRQSDILDQYMVPVIREALDLFHNRKTEDNFSSALLLNRRILEIINPIKKPADATTVNQGR